MPILRPRSLLKPKSKLGMTVSEITGALAQQYRVTQSVGGVMVTEVAEGGFAYHLRQVQDEAAQP